MYIPLFILGLGAAFFGYLTHEVFIGLGNTFYLQALFFHPASSIQLLDGSFAPDTSYITALKYLPLTTLLILFSLLPVLFFTGNTKLKHNNLDYNTLATNVIPLGSVSSGRPALWYRTFGLPTATLNHFNT
jgi:hypothetical protein